MTAKPLEGQTRCVGDLNSHLFVPNSRLETDFISTYLAAVNVIPLLQLKYLSNYYLFFDLPNPSTMQNMSGSQEGYAGWNNKYYIHLVPILVPAGA